MKQKHEKLADFKKFDGYHIGYPDGFFDLAYCTHVLERVEHPRMLRKLKRKAKND